MPREHPYKYLIEAATAVGRDVFSMPARSTYRQVLDRGMLRVYSMPRLEKLADKSIPWRINVKTQKGNDIATVAINLTLPSIDVLEDVEEQAVSLLAGGNLYTGVVRRELTDEQLQRECDYDGGAPLFVVWRIPDPDREGFEFASRELPVPAKDLRDMVIAF